MVLLLICILSFLEKTLLVAEIPFCMACLSISALSLGEYVWYLHVPRDCFTVVWDLLLYHLVTFLFAADIHVALDGTESDRLICGLGSCSENEANCLKYFLIDILSFTHVVYYMYMYIILAIRKIYLLARFFENLIFVTGLPKSVWKVQVIMVCYSCTSVCHNCPSILI